MAWARLQLAIVVANAPAELGRVIYPLLPGHPDHGSEDRITKTVGFKKLRGWFLALPDRPRERARRWMRHWLDGCAKLIKQAEANGDYSGLKGISIDYIDTSGQPLPTIKLGEEQDDGRGNDTEGKEAAHPSAGGGEDHEDPGTVRR